MDCNSALLADLYELTMLQAYYLEGMHGPASFEFFVRALPPQRNFLVAAGLEQVLDYLEQLRFDAAALDWLRASRRFDPAFLDWLAAFRFSGEVDAMPEGTLAFAGEPLLRVTAPLPQAQFVESRVMNLLHYETLVASKAARCVLAAGGRTLVDFGLRRAHGAEAGLLSARASYIAGFDGSATALAGQAFGIPVFGTMAHSYVQAHDSEAEAFAAFAHAFPASTTLLIDTYDTGTAAHVAARLAGYLRDFEDTQIRAVRIDSGNLAAEAWQVRRILDLAGCPGIGIFASGNLDEYAIAELVAQQAPVNGFGVGTRMNTSADAPYLDCAYKLVEYMGQPRRKRSPGKATWPGRKQVFRHYGADGQLTADVLGLLDEDQPGQPLLQAAMRGGVRTCAPAALAAIRSRVQAQLAALPAPLQSLAPAPPFVPQVTPALRRLAAKADRHQRAQADAQAEREAGMVE